MNSSEVSVYDNVNTPDNASVSRVYRALNDLMNVNGNLQLQLFCPLCINSFNYRFSLFEHIRKFHANFLKEVNSQTLKFKECPFCNAKFYGKHLTAKHVLHHHYTVTKKLFLNRNKCAFCSVKLNREKFGSNVKHIEEFHFLDFMEHLKRTFLNDTLEEFTQYDNSEVANYVNSNPNAGIYPNSGSKSDVEDFDEASRINCYDFTDLKQQLENLKNVQSGVKPNFNSGNKSILKDITNSNRVQKSARRVLRFDLPSSDEDKENSLPQHPSSDFKQISADEYNLLCSENKSDVFFNNDFKISEEPQHSSTPNIKFASNPKNQGEENTCKANSKSEKIIKKPRSKIKVQEKKAGKFEFQCGKCRLFFRENFELASHVKNIHKKFTLNALQPCYHCAICNAKFYKNHYLKKHHNLHKPY